jgi:hypothetical protein
VEHTSYLGTPLTGVTEEYDGSVMDCRRRLCNTARRGLGGAGTQTAGLAFGGNAATGVTAATEEYNGSTWTTSGTSMSTARRTLGGAGTQTSALAFGGDTPPATAATEEFTGPNNSSY